MSYKTTILGDSPAIFAEFEEASGSSVKDSSANQHNGVFSGVPSHQQPPLINDVTSYSVGLAGSFQYADFPAIAAYAAAANHFTAEAWIKTSDTTDIMLVCN